MLDKVCVTYACARLSQGKSFSEMRKFGRCSSAIHTVIPLADPWQYLHLFGGKIEVSIQSCPKVKKKLIEVVPYPDFAVFFSLLIIGATELPVLPQRFKQYCPTKIIVSAPQIFLGGRSFVSVCALLALTL